MIRFFGAGLLTLATVMTAVPVLAQPYSTPNRDDRVVYRPAPVEAAPLPAPGAAMPGVTSGTQPAGPYGHQLEPPPVVGPAGQPEAMRPPASVGSAPSSAMPAQMPPPVVGSAPSTAPQPVSPSATAALPPEDQPEQGAPAELPPNLQRQLVNYTTKEPAGTIIVDTPNTYLYLVLGHGKALRYGIGVGREGFTWAGRERVSRMKEWPDWYPPAEMIERQPYLPRMMAGGPGNPLGARALYLGNTLYRIHGTNQPSTIGKTVSSGCIRLLNKDIEDLYSRVQVGSRVVVLPGKPSPENVAARAGVPANPMAPPAARGPAPATAAVQSSHLPPGR